MSEELVEELMAMFDQDAEKFESSPVRVERYPFTAEAEAEGPGFRRAALELARWLNLTPDYVAVLPLDPHRAWELVLEHVQKMQDRVRDLEGRMGEAGLALADAGADLVTVMDLAGSIEYGEELTTDGLQDLQGLRRCAKSVDDYIRSAADKVDSY
jgi:hypothetical protein